MSVARELLWEITRLGRDNGSNNCRQRAIVFTRSGFAGSSRFLHNLIRPTAGNSRREAEAGLTSDED